MPDILLCVCVVEVGLGILFGFDLFLLSFYCLFFFIIFKPRVLQTLLCSTQLQNSLQLVQAYSNFNTSLD